MTNIDTAVRRMFHRGKSVDFIAQKHNISIQRVNKIISNHTSMRNTKKQPAKLRSKAFNAKVKSYIDLGFSKKEIAGVMDCSESTIKRSIEDLSRKKASKPVAKEASKPVAKKVKSTTKVKASNKRTSSFSILWGAISFSRTSTMND